jgi:hypothetical protein
VVERKLRRGSFLLCFITGHKMPPLVYSMWVAAVTDKKNPMAANSDWGYWGSAHCWRCGKFTTFDLTQEEYDQLKRGQTNEHRLH